jgi:dsDNA-specific endonuclease/ATPase MutS2
MDEDSDHLHALLDEVGVGCGDSCDVFGEVLSRRLRELAERKRFGDEFKVFNEFSKVLNDLQQVVDDVNKVFDAVSQELYRIYRECDGVGIRERIEDLMNRLRKIVGEARSRHTASH